VRGTKKKEMREGDGDRAIPLAAVTLNYRRQMFPLIGGGKTQPINHIKYNDHIFVMALSIIFGKDVGLEQNVTLETGN